MLADSPSAFTISLMHPDAQQQSAGYLDQRLCRPSSLYASGPSMSPYIDPSRLAGPSAPTLTIHPRAMLAPLNIAGRASHSNLVAVQGPSFGSDFPLNPASPTSSSRPQTAVFSHRPVGLTTSPKSAASDNMLFCRTANANGRQRTAQACEKCRDRKTKCSGTRPTCKRCSDRGLTCVWAPETRVRGSQRQQRHRRLESVGEPFSALLAPLSQPSTPNGLMPFPVSAKLPVDNGVRSAPPTQAMFFPGTALSTDGAKHLSWSDETMRAAAIASSVNRGSNALKVMGVPIRPLSAIGGGWDSVHSAGVEDVSRERSTGSRRRERSMSVSVAHIARFHDIQSEQALHQVQIPQPAPVPYFDFDFNLDALPSDLHRNGESSNESSSPPSGGSQLNSSSAMPDSNHPALGFPEFPQMHPGEQTLHQPFPGYDPTGHLSEEMMKLLHFPSGSEPHSAEGSPAQPFGFFDAGAHAHAPENSGTTSEQVTPVALPPPAPTEADFIAQYLNTEAF